ncbi:hypothetical protein LY90DRAFT_500495 [Neocallimastix californiae]|uniref:Uncharacterized protein n=1 Tax=Neocallimastix californiae TaxID=1754190 RepID=A0A1Y2FB79_9FUNG|nr:hypothetical protein LY90DRAFT_500495 [Neocallimastix californiae]|eukprot:ORY80115.1 hypothetical protein LY90DRAFT_500495 [Neocallimastix californiae]
MDVGLLINGKDNKLGKIVDTSKPILSLDKYYGEFVNSYHQYPTKNEYILFLYRKICKGSGISQILPRSIKQFADQLFERYQNVREKYLPIEFSKIFERNVSIVEKTQNKY